MGWFDDDDDDDDDEEGIKRPSLSMKIGFGGGGDNDSDDGDGEKPLDNKKKDDEGEEEEVDPLDAYMSSLQQQQQNQDYEKTSRKQQSNYKDEGRLDVENEDEATSHWEISNKSAPDKEEKEEHISTTIGSTNAKAALDSTFHKATNQDVHRQVNIQLEQVHYPQNNQNNNGGDSTVVKQLIKPTNNNSNRNSSDHDWRKQHSISCYPPYEPIYNLRQLVDVFPQQILDWNTKNNIHQPTLVQSQTLGVVLAGKDAIITASTGSGKTLAYLWPMIAHLIENHQHQQQNRASSNNKARGLVLLPTRELALQVESVAKSLLKNIPSLTALAITGGNMGRYQLSQTLIKSKPHIVLATPGRLLDVLSAQQKSKQDWLLPNITFLVLDEGDKMLAMGMAQQVTQILSNLRPDRQSMLTSATLSNKLETLCCSKWMNTPVRISIGRTGQSSSHVSQHVLCLPNVNAKRTFLKESLPTFIEVGRTIVFCATRQSCEELAQYLTTTTTTTADQSSSISAAAIPAKSSSAPTPPLALQTLHGDKHPADRKAALSAFTKGKVNILIATDVAGRGLDIPQVTTVINYDPAKNWDTHVHRIGRAGRLSAKEQNEGSAYTLLLPQNKEFAKSLISAYEREQRDVPNEVRQLVASNHGGGGGGGHHPNKRNKSGLGFDSSSSSSPYQGARQSGGGGGGDGTGARGSNDYYGPSSRKKSRWS